MKNVSGEFKRLMDERRDFQYEATILFKDGRTVTIGSDGLSIGGSGIVTSPEKNSFPLGSAISKRLTINIVNYDDRFRDYDFIGAEIQINLKFQLTENVEIINLGKYTVYDPEKYGGTITVTAMDSMHKADTEYTTELVFPVRMGDALLDSCEACGLTLATLRPSNYDYLINQKPTNITHRQFIGLCAMISGGNALVDDYGRVKIVTYNFSAFEHSDDCSGGIFDKDTPYSTCDNVYGGIFKPWDKGDDMNAGNFSYMSDYHVFLKNGNPEITTDDVQITGISIKSGEKDYKFGSEGYVLSLENQLFTGNEQDAANRIGRIVVGLKFRPFTLDHICYPLAEFGDLCYVYDRKNNLYRSVITDIDFNFKGFTVIKCSADSPMRNSGKYTSNAEVKAVIAARDEAKLQMDAYDIAAEQMNQLAANTMGFYATTIRQDDGSILAYRHDKPRLSESKVVYKSGIDGFWVTENYHGTDASTAWKAGFDSNGNAVLNMLSVIGINFDWAHGGTLTLGGNGNGNGRLTILDYTGKQIGYIDNTGAHFIKGTFSGSLDAAQGTFSGSLKAGTVEGSRIEGTLLKTYDRDNLNGIEIEFGEQRFYYNGDFFGSMQPASDVIIDETTGSSTEVPYLHFSCPILAKELGSSSDERRKNIRGWDDVYDDLLMDLRPICFTWNDGSDDRIHTGFGAQTLEKTLEAYGIKNSALVFGHEQTEYSVFYTELHAIEVASIQRNRERIEALEEKIRELEMNQKNGGNANGAPK